MVDVSLAANKPKKGSLGELAVWFFRLAEIYRCERKQQSAEATCSFRTQLLSQRRPGQGVFELAAISKEE